MSDAEKRPAENTAPMTNEDMTAGKRADAKKTAAEEKKAQKKQKKQEKKLRRELKKQKKEQKKLPPPMRRPLICLPETARVTDASNITGMVMRALVLFFAVFGMSFLVIDALGFFSEEQGAVSGWLLAGTSLLFTALFAACRVGKFRAAAIPLALAAAAGLAVYSGLNSIYIYRAVMNGVVNKLYSYGYLSIIQYAQPENYGDLGLHGAVTLAAVLLTMMYAAVYVFCLIKNSSIILPIGVTVITLVPIFVYNLTRSNWGIAMIIAAFAGAIVMYVYDRIYNSYHDSAKIEIMPGEVQSEIPPKAYEQTARERRRAEKKALAAKRRESRAMARSEKKRRRVAATADEEISDYFAAPKKRHKKSKKARPEADSAASRKERSAARRRQRAEDKQNDKQIMAARRILDADRKTRTFRGAAAGGYAGACALALTLIILFIPAITVDGGFRTIESIDSKIDYYREYVTAFLMGDDPLLDELAYEGGKDSFEPRSTEARHLSFTGARILQVETPSGSYPIYLRGWIATDYDHATGSWLTATPDSETFKKYRATFGTAIDPSERMFYGLYNYISPGTVSDIDFSKGRYSNNTSKYGFVTMQVNMKRIDLGGHLVYMPSFTNRRYSPVTTTASGKETTAMRQWWGSEASKLTYTNYFDGIYTGYRFAKDKDGYASVAYVTSMKNSGFYKNVAEAIAKFNLDRTLIERDTKEKADSFAKYGTVQSRAGVFHTDMISETKYAVRQFDDIIYYVEYDSAAGTTVITVPDTLADYVYIYNTASGEEISKKAERKLTGDPDIDSVYIAAPMLDPLISYLEFYSDAEKAELTQLWRVSDYYTDFVYSTYTGKSQSAIIAELTRRIMAEAHTVLIDYTDDGDVVETKVPRDFSRAAESGADGEPVSDPAVYEQRHMLVLEFIKWMKENCSYSLTPTLSDAAGLDGVEKFLTVTHEGYCVQFASSLALMLREAGIPARYVEGYIASDFVRTSGNNAYTSYVLDKNAHAWVEVWFDGIGWVQYEATPEYYSDMYEYRTDPTPIDPGKPGWTGDGDDEPEDPGLTDEEIAEMIKKQEEEARRRLIVKVTIISLSVAAFAALVCAAFVILHRRAKRCAAEREKLICDMEAAGTGRTSPGNAERRDMVIRYSDLITEMLRECGYAPKAGEFRREYADRIYEELGEYLRMPCEAEKTLYSEPRRGAITRTDIGNDMDAIAAAEFGGDACVITDGELFELGKLWRRLSGNAYPQCVGRWRRYILYISGRM